MTMTKRQIIHQKYKNFTLFLRSISTESDKINQIEQLSVEQLIQGYVTYNAKFKNLTDSSKEIIEILNIDKEDTESLEKITKYLSFFKEILEL